MGGCHLDEAKKINIGNIYRNQKLPKHNVIFFSDVAESERKLWFDGMDSTFFLSLLKDKSNDAALVGRENAFLQGYLTAYNFIILKIF